MILVSAWLFQGPGNGVWRKQKSFCHAWSGKYWISLSIKLMSTLSVIRFTTHARQAPNTIGTNLCEKKERLVVGGGGAAEKFFSKESSAPAWHSLRKQRRLCSALGKIMVISQVSAVMQIDFPVSVSLSPSVRGGETLGRQISVSGASA